MHLREESAETVLGQVMPGIFDACQRAGDNEAVCLGDFLHFRYKVPARIFNLVRDELKRWTDQGITVRFLPGNHDQYEVSGRNALEALGDIRGVHVYTEPQWDKDGLWIPYRKRPEDIATALQLFTPEIIALKVPGRDELIAIDPVEEVSRSVKSPPNIAFMHHGVRGAWMNDNYQDTEGLDPNLFARFKLVLCGHYHKRHRVGNVQYIGSPYQTRADEAGQSKGFARWNGETLEFFDALWGPRYHNLTVERGQTLDLEGFGSDDIVRVRTKEGVDPKAIAQYLAQAGLGRHTVTPDVESVQARLDVPQNAALAQYARAYVEQTVEQHGLGVEKLLSVFAELAV